jgi:hypothetical protein
MKGWPTKHGGKREAGIILLIAIFVLMLVSIVAIALIVSAGTETALTANYRSSATAYYAALAGLEEARGRLQLDNPDYFNKTKPSFMPVAGAQLAVDQVRYIVNPAAGETVEPDDPGNAYYDNEYPSEFNGTPITSVTVHKIHSISGVNADGIPGPLYKWVRINAVTERSLKLDVDNSGSLDPTNTPLYYDPGHVDSHGVARKSLIVPVGPPPGTAVQALEITSLAVLPNGSQKILQYLVAGSSLNLQFPAALTFVGSGVQFIPLSSLFFAIDGNDQFNAVVHGVNCVAGAPSVAAVGYTTASDGTPIQNAMSATGYPGNYRGATVAGGASLNHLQVDGNPPPNPKLLPNMQTASGLASIMQTIRDNADLTSLPASMSPSSPKTIFINGDLDMTGWTGPGYGLLAVTGNLKYDGNVTWRGIVLVVGQGTITSVNSKSGEIDGALLVAQLPGLGPASVDFSNAGNGVFYSNCYIQAALPTTTTKVLSFREVPQ